jgi:hypothetical protein
MFVTPIPANGDIVVGRDTAGRVLRVSGHPESDRVVLSIWQGGAAWRRSGWPAPTSPTWSGS